MSETSRPVTWGGGQARVNPKFARVNPRVARVNARLNQDTSTAHFTIIRLLSRALKLAVDIASIPFSAVGDQQRTVYPANIGLFDNNDVESWGDQLDD